MQHLVRQPITCAAIIAAALLLCACTSPPTQPTAAENVAPCGSFPNCASSVNDSASSYVKPLPSTQKQWLELKQWIGNQARWVLMIDDANFLHVVVSTPTLGFKDDLQLLFINQQQLIHVRSSSRLGIGDMGVNAKRVEALRQQLTTYNY
jgi:uncharacterized protein (DUF1499 family)|tara:strand:+ start:2854 stop:3303 length:450 start_codon:yes stop_codon:yes gene_type:complete